MFWLFFAVGSWEKDTNKSAAVMLLRMFLRSSAFRSKKLLYYLTNKSLLLRCFRLFMPILNFAVHLKKVYWSTPHNQNFFFKLLAPGIEPLTLGLHVQGSPTPRGFPTLILFQPRDNTKKSSAVTYVSDIHPKRKSGCNFMEKVIFHLVQYRWAASSSSRLQTARRRCSLHPERRNLISA